MIILTRRRFFALLTGLFLAVALLRPSAAGLADARPGDMVFGSDDALVTIIEYYSLNCSHCAAFHKEIFPSLKADYIDTGRLRFVFRDFPLNWPAAEAAILTHCAGPKQFIAAQDALFASYRQWGSATPSILAIAEIGESLGVTRNEFKACVESGELQRQVIESFEYANGTLGVEGTPTFFINGKKYVGGISLERLGEIIDSYD